MIIASLNGFIGLSDNTTTANVLQKVLTGLTLNGTVYAESQSVLVGTAAFAVALPIATCAFVYMKNLHTSTTVGLTWTTPVGGSNFVVTLDAGAAIILIEPVAGTGITAASLQAASGTVPVEMVLAG